MSDQTPPPAKPAAKPAPTQPTPADAAAIATAGGQGMEGAESAAQAQAQAEAAMREEATRRNVEISDDQINQIASTVIAQLEQRGAFEPAPPPTPVTSPVDTTNTGDSAASAGAPATGEPNPPRRKTFAEKFMGRS